MIVFIFYKVNNLFLHQSNLKSPLPVNPFLPIGQFKALKLIILIKCLIDILFFKVLF